MGAPQNAMITKLLLAALDSAGISDRAWQSRFKINTARLARMRQGRECLTDAELERISRATGEPWENVVLGLLGEDDKLTADTRELLSGLHALRRTAQSEAEAHGTQKRQFRALRQLVRKKSA